MRMPRDLTGAELIRQPARATASQASSSMCRMRTLSSCRAILHLGLRHHLLTEMATEALRRVHVHPAGLALGASVTRAGVPRRHVLETEAGWGWPVSRMRLGPL